MFVYVQNKEGKPLMPTNPAKARILLKYNKAKVVKKIPFTIKLTYDSTNYVQFATGGMDTGTKEVGCAVIANDKVLYQSEITIRDDIKNKMKQRSEYRHTRRSRKTRYRAKRFNNRAASKRKGRLAPSLTSKIQSHYRERNFVESILPVAHWKVELASWDIHKLTNPDVSGKGYQEGKLKNYYNVKAYVLAKDNYTCQHCHGKSKDKRLTCHHIIWQSEDGADTEDNLICLCKTCHKALHAGKWQLKSKKGKKSETKHPTQMGIAKSQLKKSDWVFEETFGYETKYKREQILKLPKSHANDAVAICCNDNQKVEPNNVVYLKKHVCKGDYRQTNGQHSEKELLTRKLFGFRKFDKVRYLGNEYFIKGKMSTGYAILMDITGHKVSLKPIPKFDKLERISARKSCILLQKNV